MFDTFEGFPVTKVKLHGSFLVPGHGEAESFYAKRGEGVGRAALTGVEMKFNGVILICRYKDNEFFIPAANISGGCI